MGPRVRGWAGKPVGWRAQGLKGPWKGPISLQTEPCPSLFLHRLSREILLPSYTRTKSSPNSPSTDCSLLKVTATLHGLYRPKKRARDRRKRNDRARSLPRGTKWHSWLVIWTANQDSSSEAESVFRHFYDPIGCRMRKTWVRVNDGWGQRARLCT